MENFNRIVKKTSEFVESGIKSEQRPFHCSQSYPMDSSFQKPKKNRTSEKERDRQTEREGERDRERQTERQRERERARESARERERKRAGERGRERDR
jgi:hypothetical protein